jgi:hypothetical protein
LRRLGSLRAVQEAELEQLIAAGATRKQAEAIHAHFRSGAVSLAPADGDASASEELAVEHAFER